MRNLLYLGYFLLKTNYPDLRASLKCGVNRGFSRAWLLADMILCSLRYGSSFVDYFNFRFFEKTAKERAAYATMGFMYRFHQRVNDSSRVPDVDSKVRFAQNFAAFCHQPFLFQAGEEKRILEFMASRIGQKIVLKDPNSTAGKGVRILSVAGSAGETLVNGKRLEVFLSEFFQGSSAMYLEDFLAQHPSLDAVSPTAVNTIRVITMVNDAGEVEILGSVFRISVDSPVDNFSMGNLAAEIDASTGIVTTGGIRKRAACDEYHECHPLTGGQILGLEIPFWSEVIAMAKDAALIVPEVRSVGWDIAVTPTGPVIIEGNSKWNKDTWQIPAGYGKKALIERYLNA